MISLEGLVERYLDHLHVERNLSSNTVQSYGRDLRMLVVTLRDAGIVEPTSVVQDHLSGYLASMAAGGCAPASQRRALSSMRQLFLYALRERLTVHNPAKELEAPNVPQTLPRVPTVDQARALFVLLEQDTTVRGLRDRVALELLYGAGMRASELCALRLGDVDVDHGMVRLVGKGNKERMVPLGEPAVVALRLYLSQARPKLLRKVATDVVIVGRSGGALTRMGLFTIVKRRARAAGLDPSVSPHTLRHAFATHLVHGGADLRAVQEMLGHASIATTEIYTHVGAEALQQTVDLHHPLSRGSQTPPHS